MAEILRPVREGLQLQPRFSANSWQGLAEALLRALERLEGSHRTANKATLKRAILISVADDMRSLSLSWCHDDGSQADASSPPVHVPCEHLPTTTDALRTEPMLAEAGLVPHASIDRAVCKVAAEMLSWTTDPATLELLEHCRYRIFLRWPGQEPVSVYEYAYGLWDE